MAKVFATDRDNIFLEMEFAKRISASRFKELVGYDTNEVNSFLWDLDARMSGKNSTFPYPRPPSPL